MNKSDMFTDAGCFSTTSCPDFLSSMWFLFPTPTQKAYLQQHFFSLQLTPSAAMLHVSLTPKLNMRFWHTEALWHKAKPDMYSAEEQEYKNVSTCWQSSCSCSHSLTQVKGSKSTWHREEGAARCVTIIKRGEIKCISGQVQGKICLQNVIFHKIIFTKILLQHRFYTLTSLHSQYYKLIFKLINIYEVTDSNMDLCFSHKYLPTISILKTAFKCSVTVIKTTSVL